MKRWSLPLAACAAVLIPAIAVLILVTAHDTNPAAANETGPVELSLGVIAAPNVTCDSLDQPDTCTVELGTQFTLTADINARPQDGFSGFQVEVVHEGLVSEDVRFVVPNFVTFPVVGVGTGSLVAGGITSLSPPILKSTYLGTLVEVDLNCTTSPDTFEISLPVQSTDLLNQNGQSIPITTVQRGAEKVADMVIINCAGEPAKICGDVNMDGAMNPLDALLILQLNAGMISTLANESSADVNSSGDVTSVDAALILQATAGLISEGQLDCA